MSKARVVKDLSIFAWDPTEGFIAMVRRIGRSALPSVLVAGVVSVLLGGGAALAQGTTDDPAQVEAGRAVFEQTCSGCHGVDGTGSQFGRSLIGIAAEQPDRAVHIASVTDGKGAMPAWGGDLSADEIDAAVSYVRLTFVEVEAEAELAITGSSTVPLLVVGLSLVLAGTLIVLTLGRDPSRPRPAT